MSKNAKCIKIEEAKVKLFQLLYTEMTITLVEFSFLRHLHLHLLTGAPLQTHHSLLLYQAYRIAMEMDGLYRKLCDDGGGGQISITERGFAVRAGGSNILILCAHRRSIGHGGVRLAVISSERNVICQVHETLHGQST